MIIKSFHDLENYELIQNFDENGRDIRLYKFENVELSGLSNYYPDVLLHPSTLEVNNFLVLPIKEMSMSLGKKSFYEETTMEFDYKENKKKFVDEDVFFFIYNTENYYHFMYDTLPFLYTFSKLNGVKLLMNFNKNKTNLLPFVKESLELFGIGENDIIIHEEGNYYRNVYLSSSLTHNGLSNFPPRKEIFEVYERMAKNGKRGEIETYDKIYISRRTWLNGSNENIGTNYTLRRRMMNEDNLVNELEKRGFKEIFGENLTMNEKVIIFSNAKVVIGAIGGTITNCIFCNPEAIIIPLVSPDFLNINYRMKFLFRENVKLFEDTSVYIDSGDIPANVRIEILEGVNKGKLGEIERHDGGNNYLVKLANNLIGWSEEGNYDKVVESKENFKTLDKGINSPWIVNIENLCIEY